MAERTQALCSPRRTARRLPAVPCRAASSAGGREQQPLLAGCVCVSNAFWGPRSLIPELFTVVQRLPLQPTAWRRRGQSGKSGAWATRRGPGLPAPRGSGLPQGWQDTRVNRCNKRCPVGLGFYKPKCSCVDTVSSNWQLAAPLVIYVSE